MTPNRKDRSQHGIQAQCLFDCLFLEMLVFDSGDKLVAIEIPLAPSSNLEIVFRDTRLCLDRMAMISDIGVLDLTIS